MLLAQPTTTQTDAITHNGQAQTSTDLTQTSINTDALNTQKVIKDTKTGGLDVNTTIDTRIFTTAGRQEIKKEQEELDGNTKAAFGMFGVAVGATAAGLLDDNEHSDHSALQKTKDNLIQARNNVVTGADKSQASLNAHIDAITDGDLTDALQNQDILNELNALLTQGTHADGSSVYLNQGTVNDQGEVIGQANTTKGHTYLNINHIDTTLETLNHEIAHHNGLAETSTTAMGKIGDFAYNIGTSLNQEDINTHRQTITPTEKTLQNLSTDEQLAYHTNNQALLNANEVQRAWEVESGDKVWDNRRIPPFINISNPNARRWNVNNNPHAITVRREIEVIRQTYPNFNGFSTLIRPTNSPVTQSEALEYTRFRIFLQRSNQTYGDINRAYREFQRSSDYQNLNRPRGQQVSGGNPVLPTDPYSPQSRDIRINQGLQQRQEPITFIQNQRVEVNGRNVRMNVDLAPTLRRISENRPNVALQDGKPYHNTTYPYLKRGVSYTEWTVPTNGVSGRGSQRIVVGSDGKMYYTPNHYKTWIQIK